MICTIPKYKSLNRGCSLTLNSVGSVTSKGISNKITGELDVSSESLYEMRNIVKTEIDTCLSSILSISEEGLTESDDNTSSYEPISWQSNPELEIQNNQTHYRSDGNNFGQTLTYENLWTPSKNSKAPPEKMRFGDGYSCIEFPDDLVSGDYPSYMWNPPLSPISHLPQSPNHRVFPDHPIVFSHPKAEATKYLDQRSRNGREQVDSRSDDFQDGSFLFAMCDDADNLRIVLNWRGLEVENIWKTRTPGILGVLFKTHQLAKQVFTKQKEIGVRFVPHDTTREYWHKGPSPKFHVIFETTRRLTVKSGKSFSNKTVGDLLMKNSRMDRGCIIWADQMKGCRLRVVGFVGKFVRKDGRVIVRDEPPSASEREVIGWVSTQCKITKEKFVLRLTGKQIKDYLCNAQLEAFE